MKKILVTGGAGFIGSHTCVALYNAGYLPVIVDDLRNSKKQIVDELEKICDQKLPFYHVDCRDQNALEKVLHDHTDIQGVIHFAANKSVKESVETPTLYFRNNIDALVTILDVMHNHSIENLIFSSSCTVYGQPDSIPVTESTPTQLPESPYGFTKLANEKLIDYQFEAQKINKVVKLRYFNPVGALPGGQIGELPLGVPDNLIPYVIQTAAGWRDELTVFGNDYNTPDGTCIRDYLHVCDLAEAHVCALEYSQNNKHVNEIFNLGKGEGTSVLDIIRTFENVIGDELPWKYGSRRSGDVEKIYADATYAKNNLKWECQFSIREALEHAWQWQQNLSKGTLK